MQVNKKLDFKNIVLVGRSFDEYYRLFNLDDIDPGQEKILDVAAGVSSFCAEATAKGYDVTACDEIYHLPAAEIAAKCPADLALALEKLAPLANEFVWDFLINIDELKIRREKTYHSFLADYRLKSNNQYIVAKLPATPFCDNEFTLSLVSYLLFLYDDHLDYDFHKRTVLELLRVTSKEVRIFPLINLKGEKSPYVAELLSDSNIADYYADIVKVNYEFRKDGDEMLRIRKGLI